MHNTKTSLIVIQQFPKYLWFISLSYTMMIVLANWFAPRLVSIFGLNTDAGTLIFPLTFLLSDLITEVYGYKHARRAIWAGFLFNAVFILFAQIIIHLPSPPYHIVNAEFDKLMGFNTRIIIASIASYLTSEPLNSFIMAKLKVKMKGRYMGIRFVLSTIFASGADSIIFCCLAFSGLIDKHNLISLIITMWFIKIIIEIFGLPFSIRLAKKLKQKECLDIYDTRTKFNVLSLDTSYKTTDNEFMAEKNPI